MGIQIKTGDSGAATVIEPEANRAACHGNNDEGGTPRPGCTRVSLTHLVHTDYRRYRATGARNAFSVIALTQGFWASGVFRISHWALVRAQSRGLRVIVNAVCVLLQKLIEVVAGICIPAQCDIGQGLYIGHFGGIFVDAQCRVGANCNLAQGVTIGKGGRGEFAGVPMLGDRVHVGANALILGRITIGNDAVIGPGAVVMNSVPPCGVAIGNPARIVGFDGSFGLVKYDQMEDDPARRLAVEAQNHRTSAVRGEAWNA